MMRSMDTTLLHHSRLLRTQIDPFFHRVIEWIAFSPSSSPSPLTSLATSPFETTWKLSLAAPSPIFLSRRTWLWIVIGLICGMIIPAFGIRRKNSPGCNSCLYFYVLAGMADLTGRWMALPWTYLAMCLLLVWIACLTVLRSTSGSPYHKLVQAMRSSGFVALAACLMPWMALARDVLFLATVARVHVHQLGCLLTCTSPAIRSYKQLAQYVSLDLVNSAAELLDQLDASRSTAFKASVLRLTDRNGQTLLMKCIRRNQIAMATLLFAHELDLSTTKCPCQILFRSSLDLDGNSPLTLAIQMLSSPTSRGGPSSTFSTSESTFLDRVASMLQSVGHCGHTFIQPQPLRGRLNNSLSLLFDALLLNSKALELGLARLSTPRTPLRQIADLPVCSLQEPALFMVHHFSSLLDPHLDFSLVLWAIQHKHFRLAQSFLDKALESNGLVSPPSMVATHMACLHSLALHTDQQELFKFLLRLLPASLSSLSDSVRVVRSLQSVLSAASAATDPALVRLLLEHAAGAGYLSTWTLAPEQHPLVVAFTAGSLAVLQELVVCPALQTHLRSLVDAEGFSLLAIICRCDLDAYDFNEDALQAALGLLLFHGADINSTGSPTGVTPLMVASAQGKLPLVRALLSLGANPTAKDVSQKNAFIYAAQLGQRHITQLLYPYFSQDSASLQSLSFA